VRVGGRAEKQSKHAFFKQYMRSALELVLPDDGSWSLSFEVATVAEGGGSRHRVDAIVYLKNRKDSQGQVIRRYCVIEFDEVQHRSKTLHVETFRVNHVINSLMKGQPVWVIRCGMAGCGARGLSACCGASSVT
jgi:uncharacterized protein YlbG (UPF0298 family)